MGLCSQALFASLVNDLSGHLPSLSFSTILFHKRHRELAWPGVSKKQFACLSLLESFLKKFEDDKSSKADDVALAKFLAANSHCENFSSIDTSDMTDIQAICLGTFKAVFNDFFFERRDETYWLTLDGIMSNIAPGPGASVGVKGTSFYEKIVAGPLTGTRKSLFSLYKRETSKYTLWDEAEKIRSNHFGDFVQVPGSRLSFVPKSQEVSRTICTEPSLNMLIQKGIGKLFELQLDRKFGINLSTQPDKNRMLAKIGSENGAYGTIDLSSASDTVSMNLLREILPSYVFSWLKEARSDSVQLPDGSLCPLHMVSSMGNAFTFPLQTILFASVVIAVYRSLGIEVVFPRGNSLGTFAVFGDDIIVRREAYSLVTDLLRRIGFFVNLDKSFNEGPFRESCGSDFWDGFNVRGVYLRSLKTKQDLYSAINRLIVWSANHCVALSDTISYLWTAGRLKFLPVPPWESDVAGLKVPLWLASPERLKRHKLTKSIMYLRYLPNERPVSLVDVQSRPNSLSKGFFHNPAGILLSAVAGYLREGKILKRQNLTYYKKRVAVAPCWDYINPCHSNLTSDGWHRWLNIYVGLNIGSCLAPSKFLE